jgi:hypothetical protein
MKASRAGSDGPVRQLGGATLAATFVLSGGGLLRHPVAAQEKVSVAFIVKDLSTPFFIPMGDNARLSRSAFHLRARQNMDLRSESGVPWHRRERSRFANAAIPFLP